MNYEIDFLPVGNGDKSGDTICLVYSSFDTVRDGYGNVEPLVFKKKFQE